MPRLTLVFALILTTGGIVSAQQSRPSPATRQNRPTVPASLGAAMREMGQIAERLAKEAPNASQKDAALTDVILLQRDAAIAKTGTPDNVRNLAPDAKAKALAEFRAMMTKLIKDTMSLEDAINAEKPDDIKTLMAQIGDDEKAGHEKFNPQ